MVSSTSPSVSYKYDGHKRRVQKTEGGQTSYTMYGQNGKLMHKLKGGVSTHYIYAGSLLIAELQGTTVNYLHTDLLGSPIKGDNGTAYSEHYRPWGEKKDHPTQLADDVGYTGHQSDVATGLTYMQARYYDPVVGRFMAVDPVRFNGNNPTHFGLYTYANNNPISYVDPDGQNALVLVCFATPVSAAVCGVGAIAVIWTVYNSTPEGQQNSANIANAIVQMADSDGAEDSDDGRVEGESSPLPENPDDLTDEGYEETSHPTAKGKGHRTFENPETGDKVRHDKGKEGKPGHEGKDHYHKYNPNRTGRHDEYMDKDGNPTARGSEDSHLYPDRKEQ